MERDTNQMSQSSSLCRSGCGFYGSPANDGLCSKCFKDAVKRKQSSPLPSVTGQSSQTASPITGDTLLPNSGEALNTASPTVPAVTSQESTKSEQASESEAEYSASSQLSSTERDSESTDQQDDSQLKEQKKKRNRCNVCRKKLGLTGFRCRCGGLFCSFHRYSNEHNCTFDYKEFGAQEIRKNNPLVVGEKIKKI